LACAADGIVVQAASRAPLNKSLNVMRKLAKFRAGAGEITEIGYVNDNDQQCHGTLGIRGTDHG